MVLARLRIVVGIAATAAACGGGTSGDPASSSLPPPLPSSSAAEADADVPPPPPLSDAGADGPLPSPTDGIQNGLETDVDCGGPGKDVPRCGLGKKCAVANDCALEHCNGGTCAVLAPSCVDASTMTCGKDANENCCTSLPVPGGSYNRNNDPQKPATVSAFKLDKFEVTVGRLRAFFVAKNGNLRASPPAPGAGAHPKIANSGWRSTFDIRLPASWTEINERLGAVGCAKGGDNSDGGAATWTPTPGPYEDLPITCIDWYTLFAFCAWDGGRLPTDAEWGYAAQGGSQQRAYAWSQPGDPSTVLTWGVHDALVAGALWDPVAQDFKFSVGTPYRTTDPVTGKVNDGPSHMTQPGRKTGYGRWGHADLTGNVLEYLLDSTPTPTGACNDCANVDWPDPPPEQEGWYPGAWWTGSENDPVYVDGRRALRGGSWDPTHVAFAWFAYEYYIAHTYYAAGGRCARD